MNIDEIKNYWQKNEIELYVYSQAQLNDTSLLPSTKHFLQYCGLPDSAAPFLSFDNCKEDRIPTPNNIFSIHWPLLENYLFIGSNGCGDPICIDKNNNNQIIYLNHDNDFEISFINSDVQKLMQCLILYKSFIKTVNQTNSNNYIEGNIDSLLLDKLKQDFLKADDKCLKPNAMWYMEIESMLL